METKNSVKKASKEERQAWIKKGLKTKKEKAKQLQEEKIKIQNANIDDLKKLIEKLNYLTLGMTLKQLSDKQKDEVASILLKIHSL